MCAFLLNSNWISDSLCIRLVSPGNSFIFKNSFAFSLYAPNLLKELRAQDGQISNPMLNHFYVYSFLPPPTIIKPIENYSNSALSFTLKALASLAFFGAFYLASRKTLSYALSTPQPLAAESSINKFGCRGLNTILIQVKGNLL